MAEYPPCGLYRTTVDLDEQLPGGRLVYFHNHGDPGPGLYFPERWFLNRATFSRQGRRVTAEQARTLVPLPPEGLYRVVQDLVAGPEGRRVYERGLLLQLGYNGRANPILFTPEWSVAGLSFPEQGQMVTLEQLSHLERLVVADPARVLPAHDLN